ncbi:MAG: ankyrin repeat domain-containing protein [Dokdonella sp.]
MTTFTARILHLSACVATLLVMAACGSHYADSPVVDTDTRANAYSDPRRVFVRIQSNLERVAARRPRHVLPVGQAGDALERVVDAYAAFLEGDDPAMNAALADVAGAARKRRSALPTGEADYQRALAAEREAYFAVIDHAAASTSPLVRLLAGLRAADSVLFIETAQREFMTLATRRMNSKGPAQSVPDALDETWLRLPCRTVQGRAAQFATAAVEAKSLNGPLLACPLDTADPSRIEAIIAEPQRLMPHVDAAPAKVDSVASDVAPPPPWDRETAVQHMAKNPDAAEVALESATGDAVGKLDFALFLHAFRKQTPTRDARIALLLEGVEESPTNEDCCGEPIEGADAAYDGSDESLVPRIVWASESGVANSESAFYAIPCDVLVAQPKLLAATQSRYGSNRDNFVPRSGCGWGRGTVHGFPDAELRAFVDAAAEADGDFIDTYEGTMKYGFEVAQTQAFEALKLDPRGLLANPEPVFAYPYETWSMLSIGNQQVTAALKSRYEQLHEKIAAFYQLRGLNDEESRRAAKSGLFGAVLGAECGGAVPRFSPRATLLAGGVPQDLAQLDPADRQHDSPETEACAAFAGMDPLLHVAVASPKALDSLLARVQNVDLGDVIEKTPLMLAAQHDLIESARVLLAHHAAVNATTMETRDGWSYSLAHDARTPLMYAAASGSLAMIQLLLDAGADPFQADTKGARAIDYLLGFGPVAPNSRLTQTQRTQAARLLF